MPEPRPLPKPRPRTSSPPAAWPASVPGPQSDSITVTGPGRAERFDVLTGATRLRVHARTAAMQYAFTCYFTPQQMQDFETWYRFIARDHDGEFYARWIGGARVVAFIEPYEYSALGEGYALTGRLIRTRIDASACDDFINAIFGAIYRDNGVAPDIYRGDLSAADIYIDDYPLSLIDRNEC